MIFDEQTQGDQPHPTEDEEAQAAKEDEAEESGATEGGNTEGGEDDEEEDDVPGAGDTHDSGASGDSDTSGEISPRKLKRQKAREREERRGR